VAGFVLFYAFPLVMAEQSAARADALVRANRPVPATAAYRVAAEWSALPNASYHERLARAQALAGRPAHEAEQALQQAILANPRAIHERVLLAGLYGGGAFQPPRLAEAEELYEQAVGLNPNDMALRTSWAHLLEATGQAELALANLEKVLEQNEQLSPDEPERLTPSQLEQVKGRIEALRPASRDQAS
jgi:tetratricopeptide (TPR) repeat protein